MRQYFSLYRAVSQREGERKEKFRYIAVFKYYAEIGAEIQKVFFNRIDIGSAFKTAFLMKMSNSQ